MSKIQVTHVLYKISICAYTTVDLEIIYGSVINYIWYIGESVLIYLHLPVELWYSGPQL
jgi:hypothetical protein